MTSNRRSTGYKDVDKTDIKEGDLIILRERKYLTEDEDGDLGKMGRVYWDEVTQEFRVVLHQKSEKSYPLSEINVQLTEVVDNIDNNTDIEC